MRAVLIRALKYSPWNPCLKTTPPYSSIRQGFFALVAGCDDGEIIVREVLTAWRQMASTICDNWPLLPPESAQYWPSDHIPPSRCCRDTEILRHWYVRQERERASERGVRACLSRPAWAGIWYILCLCQGLASQVLSVLKCRISLIFCFLDELLLTGHFNFNYFSFFFEVSKTHLPIYNYLYIN